MSTTRHNSWQDAKGIKGQTTIFADRALRSTRAKGQKRRSATALQLSPAHIQTISNPFHVYTFRGRSSAKTIKEILFQRLQLKNCFENAAGNPRPRQVTIPPDRHSSIFEEVVSLSTKVIEGVVFHDELLAFMVDDDIYGSSDDNGGNADKVQERLLVEFMGQVFSSLLGKKDPIMYSLEAGSILASIVQEKYNLGLHPIFEAILLWYALRLAGHLCGFMRQDETISIACEATITALHASSHIKKPMVNVLVEKLSRQR